MDKKIGEIIDSMKDTDRKNYENLEKNLTVDVIKKSKIELNTLKKAVDPKSNEKVKDASNAVYTKTILDVLTNDLKVSTLEMNQIKDKLGLRKGKKINEIESLSQPDQNIINSDFGKIIKTAFEELRKRGGDFANLGPASGISTNEQLIITAIQYQVISGNNIGKNDGFEIGKNTLRSIFKDLNNINVVNNEKINQNKKIFDSLKGKDKETNIAIDFFKENNYDVTRNGNMVTIKKGNVEFDFRYDDQLVLIDGNSVLLIIDDHIKHAHIEVDLINGGMPKIVEDATGNVIEDDKDKPEDSNKTVEITKDGDNEIKKETIKDKNGNEIVTVTVTNQSGEVRSQECSLNSWKIPLQSEFFNGAENMPIFTVEDLMSWGIANYSYVEDMFKSLEIKEKLGSPEELPRLKDFIKLWMQQIDKAVSDIEKGLDINGEKISFTDQEIKDILLQSKKGRFTKIFVINKKKYDLVFNMWTKEMEDAYEMSRLGHSQKNPDKVHEKYEIKPVGLRYDEVIGHRNDKLIKVVKAGDRVLYSDLYESYTKIIDDLNGFDKDINKKSYKLTEDDKNMLISNINTYLGNLKIGDISHYPELSSMKNHVENAFINGIDANINRLKKIKEKTNIVLKDNKEIADGIDAKIQEYKNLNEQYKAFEANGGK